MQPTTSPLLDAIIQGWQDYQEQLVAVLRPLTLEQLAFRVAPDLRSVGEIVTHVIRGRAFWFAEVLKEGDDEMATIVHWNDEGQLARTTAECVHGLEVTWQLIQDALSRWTPAELTVPIVLPWLGPEYPITRAFVIWHLLEHDLHHGGELSHSLGMQGLVIKLPPPPPEH
ncbi:MAG: DinB family protein [Chloroflexota bacterium]|nr:DinB family protein [Chloroflexota bacterium]